MEDREELRKTQLKAPSLQLQEGRESGPGIPADAVFDRLEAKFSKLSADVGIAREM